MSNTNVIFCDEHEATLHEKLLAHFVAEALLLKIRMQNESDFVKREKKEFAATN